MLESYEIFKNLYVTSRQETIEWFLNMMAKLSGATGELKLKDAKPITIEEEVVVESEPEQFRSSKDDLKIFGKFGQKKDKFKVVRSISVSNEFGSDDVANMEQSNFNMFFDKIGDIRAGLTELDKNVLAMLREGEDGTSISKAIDEPIQDVAKSISKLSNLNLLVDNSTSSLGEQILDGLDVEIDQFEVRYSYEVKAGLGAEIIPTSREFCEELIGQNRMYLRSEIDTISGALRS